MNNRVGLWIDLNKAVIVSITDGGEETIRISADMEHYVRHSTSVPGDGSPEDVRDQRYWAHVGEYYDKVIAHIGHAQALQIFGPGEAKSTLKSRLELKGLLPGIVSIDEADKLTDRQILTRVKARFPVRALFDLS